MTTVKNIKKNEYPIPSDTMALCKRLGVLKHLPTDVPKDLSFELHNTTSELANALRRCINSELTVMIMDFEPQDLSTDDSFIITHELRKRINYIPIRQISTITFGLNVHNTTDEIIPVYSSRIKDTANKKKDSSDKKKDKEKSFSETFILTYLRPGKRLIINNIHIISGQSYNSHSAFSFEGKVGYKCLNLPDKNENTLTKPVSMIDTQTSYKISVPRQKYIDPVSIVKMTLKCLNNKLDTIYKIVDSSSVNFYSSEMEITYIKDKAIFKIFNETYTIGNLLSRYGFIVDTTIENIHCIKLHPSFNYINVEIHHTDPRSIMLLAINLIRKELDNIDKAF